MVVGSPWRWIGHSSTLSDDDDDEARRESSLDGYTKAGEGFPGGCTSVLGSEWRFSTSPEKVSVPLSLFCFFAAGVSVALLQVSSNFGGK